MGWGPGPAGCSTKCSGIHWQGRSSICPHPCDTESRLLSLPILWAICPGRTLWTQALTENVHVPEGFWRPQDCSFQHEMLRSVVEFCGKFIHTYSYLTEKEMPSVIFWLPKCCSCIKKRDFSQQRVIHRLFPPVYIFLWATSKLSSTFMILFLVLLWGNGSLNLNLICPAAVFTFSSDCASHMRSKDKRI